MDCSRFPIRGALGLLMSCLLVSSAALSFDVPVAPAAADDPGSRVYATSRTDHDLQVDGVDIMVSLPRGVKAAPVIALFKGQGAPRFNYQDAIDHFTGKGIAVIFVEYARHFFDSRYEEMALRAHRQIDAAFAAFPDQLDPRRVVFAGVSKGAQVALYALTVGKRQPLRTLLFEVPVDAPPDFGAIPVDAPIYLFVGDRDIITPLSDSLRVFDSLRSTEKQLTVIRSYPTDPEQSANHWAFCTRNGWKPHPVAMHYFAHWRFLTAAAWTTTPNSRWWSVFAGSDAAETPISGLRNLIVRAPPN